MLSFVKDIAFLQQKKAHSQTLRDMLASGGHAGPVLWFDDRPEQLEDVLRARAPTEANGSVQFPCLHKLVCISASNHHIAVCEGDGAALLHVGDGSALLLPPRRESFDGSLKFVDWTD